MFEENKPKPKLSPDSGSPSTSLRRHLRSIQRMRRDTLQRRSECVETLLTNILLQLNDSEKDQLLGPSSSNTSSSSLSKTFDDNTSEWESIPGAAIIRPYTTNIDTLHNQIDFLNQELESAKKLDLDLQAEELRWKEQLETLRSQLLESRHETIELRIQNAELTDGRSNASAVSQADARSSSMSWEERKEEMMKRFDRETDLASDPHQIRAEFDRLVAVSEREIADRDQQLDELRQMLDSQSNVRGEGFAMGAGAIQAILDADPFIQQERERLRLLQEELQQKLRDAEIEISVEKARLSRERLELQGVSEALKAQSTDQVTSNTNSDGSTVFEKGPRSRKWLQRLGLRED